MPTKDIITSQKLDQYSEILATEMKTLSSLHKGIMNNKSFALELVVS